MVPAVTLNALLKILGDLSQRERSQARSRKLNRQRHAIKSSADTHQDVGVALIQCEWFAHCLCTLLEQTDRFILPQGIDVIIQAGLILGNNQGFHDKKMFFW